MDSEGFEILLQIEGERSPRYLIVDALPPLGSFVVNAKDGAQYEVVRIELLVSLGRGDLGKGQYTVHVRYA